MFRTALVALILSSSTAMALGPQDQLYANVAQELPHYVQGVDVSTLSHHQISAIYMIMYESRSAGDKQRAIRSVLGGQYSLRGLLFK
jgi:hypothetical protein